MLVRVLEREGGQEEREEEAVHTAVQQTLCHGKENITENTDSTWEMPPPMQTPLHSSESRHEPFLFYPSFE